jgi:hypothetical protein
MYAIGKKRGVLNSKIDLFLAGWSWNGESESMRRYM